MYRQLRPLIGKQEGGKASEDCTVVACRIAVCAIKREGAEGVLGTRRCATGEQQPCNLGVMECREVVEEALLARQDCTQVSFDELRSAKRNAKGNNTALCQRDFLATNPNRGVGGKGKHTRWENASGVPNLGLSSFETETSVMPQVMFKSTVQLSDSGRGGEDVNVVKICQRLLALEKLRLQGPEGRLSRQERTWPALRGRLARHPQLEGFGGSGRPQPRRSTTHEHTTCGQKGGPKACWVCHAVK